MTAIDTHASHGAPGLGHQPHAADEHGHGHSEYPFLAHHFDSPAQQFDSGKLGMWLFLATEILFFGALFAMYAIMRYREPEVFSYASHYLNTILGGVNTCVLILSSLTMALAVHFAQRNKQKLLVFCLALTFLGAVGFLVIKYFEYTHKFHENLIWGPGFYQPINPEEAEAVTHPEAAPLIPALQSEDVAISPGASAEEASLFKLPAVESSSVKKAAIGPNGLAPDLVPALKEEAAAEQHVEQHLPHLEDPRLPVNTHRFFAIYYCMTGLHGVHVLVGMVVIGWLVVAAMKGRFNSDYYTPVDLGGLYWHIVDLIWIFLFPLFYLIH